MNQENPCQHLVRRPMPASPQPLHLHTPAFRIHTRLVLPSHARRDALPAAIDESPPTQGIHPFPLFPEAQSFCIISLNESLLTWSFNNRLCGNSSQMYMSAQMFLRRSTPICPTPDWESLPRCFSSISNSFQIIFSSSIPSSLKMLCHLLYCPQLKYEPFQTCTG